MANSVAASLRIAAVLLGKFVVSKSDVLPVLAGSLVVMENCAMGKEDDPSVSCQLLIVLSVPPKLHRCELRDHVRSALNV